MHTFVMSTPRLQLLYRHLPLFLTSLVIAEVFYKFHSFTLECLAFFATWFVLDMLVTSVIALVRPNR